MADMHSQPVYAQVPSFVSLYHLVHRMHAEYPGQVEPQVLASLERLRQKLLLGRFSEKEIRKLERSCNRMFRTYVKRHISWDRVRAIELYKQKRLN